MRLSSDELYDEAEKWLGDKIDPEEMKKAEPYARRKLALINQREGTSHEDDYLAILIAETVKSDRFSRFTFLLCDLMREEESGPDDIGTKKEPRSKARPFTDTPIISRPELLVKEA